MFRSMRERGKQMPARRVSEVEKSQQAGASGVSVPAISEILGLLREYITVEPFVVNVLLARNQ